MRLHDYLDRAYTDYRAVIVHSLVLPTILEEDYFCNIYISLCCVFTVLVTNTTTYRHNSNIYRPPRMLREQILQFINEFASVIQSLKNNNKHIAIAGDFNLHLLKINQNELCSDFLDLLMT